MPVQPIRGACSTNNWRRKLLTPSTVCNSSSGLKIQLSRQAFVSCAVAPKLGMGFWPAFLGGFVLASITVGIWLWVGPRSL